MASNQVRECLVERLDVEYPLEPHCQRKVVRRAWPVELMQEPETRLRVRERKSLRPGLWCQRRTRRTAQSQVRPDLGDRRGLEQGADGQLHAECGANPADQAGHEQRMATQREEVVVDADVLHRKNARKDVAQDLLFRRARSPAGLTTQIGRREGSAIDLPARRQWERVQDHDGRRHHVVGHLPRELPA